MAHVVKRGAVRVVKPLVDERTWQRLRRLGGAPAAAPRSRPSLTEIGVACGTDKASAHSYTGHYQRHFEHLRDEEFTLFEIGIGGGTRRTRGGESLRMWKKFFSRATVVGLDINDKSYVQEPRIRVYQGDQADPEILTRIMRENAPVTIVVDDGSHRPEHVRASFDVLFPLLPEGGLYAIEDTQTSYWPPWGGSVDRHARGTTMALVKDLVDGLNYEEFLEDSYEPSYTDRHVCAVHAFHNLVIIEKGVNAEGSNRHRTRRAREAAAQLNARPDR